MQPENMHANPRNSRISDFLPKDEPLYENGFELTFPIPRYIAIEYSSQEEVLWAYQSDDLVSLARSMDDSDTPAAYTDVWDLDTNQRVGVSTRVISFFDYSANQRVEIPAPVAPRALITIEDGCVRDVSADAPLRVRVIDYDAEYSDTNHFSDIRHSDGTTEPALLSEWNADHSNPDRVSEIFSISIGRTKASSVICNPTTNSITPRPGHREWRHRLEAFLLGMREFRRSCTTHVEEHDGAYECGREWAHRLTLRFFES